MLKAGDETNYTLKIEYRTDGTVELTMNGLYLNNQCGLTFGQNTLGTKTNEQITCTVPLVINLVGENYIKSNGNGSYGPLNLFTTGDVIVQGEGSLELDCNRSGDLGAISTYGDLLLDKANVKILLNDETNNRSSVISSLGGNVTVNGGNLVIDAYDAHNGNNYEAAKHLFYITSATVGEETVGGNLTIQGGAKVSAMVSLCHNVADADATAGDGIVLDGDFTITDSDVEIGMDGTYKTGCYLFLEAPVLNFAGGKTVTASTANTSYNRTTNVMTPGTLTDYAAVTDITTLKYFSVKHTCVEGNPVPQPVADCATAALAYTYCTVCGEKMSETSVPVTPTADHTAGEMIEVERQEATADADGYIKTQMQCAVCGETYGEITETAIVRNPSTIYFGRAYNYASVSSGYKVSRGSTVYYKIATTTVTQGDASLPVKYLTTGSASNYCVKFTYPITGAATLELKDLDLSTAGTGLVIGAYYAKCSTANTAYTNDPSAFFNVPINVIITGTNTIDTTVEQGNHMYLGGLNFFTAGDVTFSGDGTLNVIDDNKSGHGTICTFGDITFNNTNVNISVGDANGYKSAAMYVVGGDIVIKGGKMTVNGQNTGAASNTFYNAIKVVKNAAGEGGALTICDKAKVTVIGGPDTGCYLVSASAFNIVDSEVEFAIVANDIGKAFVSDAAPTISDSCDAVAGTEVGTYADGVLTAPATDEYNADDIATYKYLKVAPGLPKLYGASVILENSLDMEFAVEVDKVANGSYAEIVRTYADGKPNHVVKIMLADATVNNGFYVFRYEDIAAKEMGDKITVTIYDANDEAITKAWEDSVYGYALRMLRGDIPYGHNQAQFEELKKTLVDMIYYGYAAQTYFQYDGVVDPENDLSDEEKALASDLANLDLTFEGEQPVKTGGYVGTSFVLESDISMLMAIDRNVIGDASTAKVTFTNYLGQPQTEVVLNADDSEDGFAIFTFNGLVVADGRCDVTWSFYKNGETTATVTVVDSVVKYTARVNLDLAKYLMAYSDAADVYFNMMAQAV